MYGYIKLLFFITLCAFNITVTGQTFIKQWDIRLGGSSTDRVGDFIQTRDSGFILAGISSSRISYDKTQPNWDTTNTSYDFWVVKTDALGQKQWDKRFGGTYVEHFGAVVEVADGYIVGGTTESGQNGNIGFPMVDTSLGKGDYWIVKIDMQGSVVWERRFGGLRSDDLNDIAVSANGDILLAGSSASHASGSKSQDNWGDYKDTDYWAVLLDAFGNYKWDKRFGGTLYDYLNTVAATDDGGFLLGGVSLSDISGNKTEPNRSGQTFTPDIWLVKIDADGNLQWDKTLGGTLSDNLSDVAKTADGGFLVGGTSTSGIGGDKTQANYSGSYGDWWIIKIDALGNKVWDKVYGGIAADDIKKIVQAADNGYLISGISNSPISGDKTESNLGAIQGWLVKIDAAGQKQWNKTIFLADNIYFAYAIETFDGCFAAAMDITEGIGGYNTHPNRDSILDFDYWMLKFCMDDAIGINDPDNSIGPLYPNPTTGKLTIQTSAASYSFQILATDGRVLMQNPVKQQANLDIDVSTLPAGLYFLQLWDGTQQVVKKFMKQ